MQESIESLSARIVTALHPDYRKFPGKDFEAALRKVNAIEFLSFNARRLPYDSFIELLLYFDLLWSGFGINEWKALMDKVRDHQPALVAIIRFLRRYLGIDGLALFEVIEGTDPKVRKGLRDWLGDHYRPLRPEEVEKRDHCTGGRTDFAGIRVKLLSAGAPVAKPRLDQA